MANSHELAPFQVTGLLPGRTEIVPFRRDEGLEKLGIRVHHHAHGRVEVGLVRSRDGGSSYRIESSAHGTPGMSVLGRIDWCGVAYVTFQVSGWTWSGPVDVRGHLAISRPPGPSEPEDTKSGDDRETE